MYLDCFHFGAALGNKYPVNSYGPATEQELRKLQAFIGHNFHRTEIVDITKGQSPLPMDLWPKNK